MAERSKLISLEGLDAFKTKIEEEIDAVTVDISKEEGNAIEEKDDGLYVSSVQGVEISKEQGNTLVEKEDGLYVAGTTVNGIIIKVQATEPKVYTPGLVWIDGGNNLETSEILYQTEEPSAKTNGLGWVG